MATHPGTRPKTLYDHGKLMMAKQMYSEKSRAAVFGWWLVPHCTYSIGDRDAPDLLPTACAVLDGIALLKFVLPLWANNAVVAVRGGDGGAL